MTVIGGEVMMSLANCFFMGRATHPLLMRQFATTVIKFLGPVAPICARKSFSEIMPVTRPLWSTTGTPEIPFSPMTAATSARGVSSDTTITSLVMIVFAVISLKNATGPDGMPSCRSL